MLISDYVTTSTFNNVVRSQVGNFFIMHENIRSFGKFLTNFIHLHLNLIVQLTLLCFQRDGSLPTLVMLFRVTLAFIHIVLTKQEAVSLCSLEIVIHQHIWPNFQCACILWDKCGEGFTLKQLHCNYYWCLQTTRQIKDSRVYNKIEWNFVINFTIWPCIHSWWP